MVVAAALLATSAATDPLWVPLGDVLVVDEADLVLLGGGAHGAQALEHRPGRRLRLEVPTPLEEVVLLRVGVLRPLLEPLRATVSRNTLSRPRTSRLVAGGLPSGARSAYRPSGQSPLLRPMLPFQIRGGAVILSGPGDRCRCCGHRAVMDALLRQSPPWV